MNYDDFKPKQASQSQDSKAFKRVQIEESEEEEEEQIDLDKLKQNTDKIQAASREEEQTAKKIQEKIDEHTRKQAEVERKLA